MERHRSDLLKGKDTLLLSGGGLKTLAFCGALENLDLSGFNTFAGVSAGSMLALCLCLGYTAEEASGTLRETDIASALANTASPVAMMAGLPLMDQEPIASGLAQWMRKKGVPADVSFRHLRAKTGRSLRVVVCGAGDRPRLRVLDVENSPDTQVLRAVLAATAVPLAFSPVWVDGVPYSDAGVVNNLALFSCPPASTIALLSGADGSHLGLLPAGMTLFADKAMERMDFLVQCELRTFKKNVVIRMPRLPGPTFHLFRLGSGSDDDVCQVLQQGRDAMAAYLERGVLVCFVCLLVAFGGVPWKA